METIGARVINELYINHLFSVALTLHGGTESLTYAYGTPNHLVDNEIPKVPMDYFLEDGKAINPTPHADSLLKAEIFRERSYDLVYGKSSEPPDAVALKSMKNIYYIYF